MRTAIYIEDGVIQLVLTPDNEWEKKALASFHDAPFKAQIFDGEFYDCRGGWTKQAGHYPQHYSFGTPNEKRSLILRVDQSVPAAPEATP